MKDFSIRMLFFLILFSSVTILSVYAQKNPEELSENPESEIMTEQEDSVEIDNHAASDSSSNFSSAAAYVSVKTGCMYGVSSISCAALKGMIARDGNGSVSVDFYKKNEDLISDFLNSKIDVCFLPYSQALKLMEYDPEQIVCGGIIQKSNFYLLNSDGIIKSYADLLGKTVSIPKDDENCQKLFLWILKQYGIPVNQGPRGITLNSLDTSVEIVPKLISKSIRYGILSEPYASVCMLKNRKLRRTVDLQKQFDSITGKFSAFPETVLLVHRDFTKSTDFNEFEQLFHSVIDYSLLNPVKVSQWNKKYNSFGTDFVTDLSFFRLNFCFENRSSSYDDLVLAAKIIFPDSKFVSSLNRSNFSLYE